MENIHCIKDELAALSNLGNVLEFACGNCTYTTAIARGAEHVLATDFSDEMVEVSKKLMENHQAAPDHIHWIYLLILYLNINL